MKRVEEELRRRDAILEAVRFAAERLLGDASSWEETVRAVLRRLGEATQASRVYVSENSAGADGELWASQRHEWVASGIDPQIDNALMVDLPYRAAGYQRWAHVLGRGEPVHGHTRNFPAGEQPELRKQGIRSLVVVPIFVDGRWWGQIGFDECVRERDWSVAEIGALSAAAGTLGAAIRRKRIEEELRRSEGELRESEERFRSAFGCAAIGMALVRPDGRWVRVNRPFCDIVGYAESEMLGMSFHDITHPDDLDADLANMRRLLAGEIRSYTMEKRHLHKNGHDVWVLLSASLVRRWGRAAVRHRSGAGHHRTQTRGGGASPR